MGALDSLDYARDFQDSTGVSFQLLWDESRGTWQDLEVTAQHTVIVFDSNGEQLDTWVGFDGDRILAAVG